MDSPGSPSLGALPRDARVSELYRTYGPTIFARCVRLLGEGPAAEDATQETFVRVLRHLDRAPNAEECLAWIYRIATNYCLNELRDRRRRPDLVGELPDLAGEGAERILADRDLAAKLVGHAPDKLRVVAWLHHVDGIDQGEVARVLGISRRTVVMRLSEFHDYARAFASKRTR